MGQLPVTCGLFFSLGHSTIVIVVVSVRPFSILHLQSEMCENLGRHPGS